MTKDDLDRLEAIAEADPEGAFEGYTVLALIQRVRELEDKHWIEETETLRLDSPAGREYSRMEDELQAAKGELKAMHEYLTSREPLSLTRNERMAKFHSTLHRIANHPRPVYATVADELQRMARDALA